MNSVQYTVEVKDIDSFIFFNENFVTKPNLHPREFKKM
jgi:hypothetical protein